MASFDNYIPKLKKWEGGFANNPNDPGGATMCGVTLATYREYFGRSKTVSDLKNISDSEWRFIMKKYWDRCKADQIENQSIAEMLVDWHINAGMNAIKKAQAALGLQSDGIIGPKSLAALNGPNRVYVFNTIKSARISYYQNIARANSSKKVFLRGWLNRTEYFKFL